MTRIRNWTAPSISAASSSSLGMLEKYPIMIQVQNGMVSIGKTSTMLQYELSSPSERTIWNSGMNSSDSGIR